MNSRPLKMADACAVSGYTRDQMRGLIRDLPSFIADQGLGRNRIFTRAELLSIAIIAEMEQKYGLKRTAIGSIVRSLINLIQLPREVDHLACLVVITGNQSVSYSRLDQSINEGLVIPLAPIFDQLDTYLGAKVPQKQIEIAFKPSAISS